MAEVKRKETGNQCVALLGKKPISWNFYGMRETVKALGV
jgi:hypothetical protein